MGPLWLALGDAGVGPAALRGLFLLLVLLWLLLLPGQAIGAMVRAAAATEPLSGPLLGGHMATIRIHTNWWVSSLGAHRIGLGMYHSLNKVHLTLLATYNIISGAI